MLENPRLLIANLSQFPLFLSSHTIYPLQNVHTYFSYPSYVFSISEILFICCRSVYFSDSVVKLHTFGELTPDCGSEQAGVTILY